MNRNTDSRNHENENSPDFHSTNKESSSKKVLRPSERRRLEKKQFENNASPKTGDTSEREMSKRPYQQNKNNGKDKATSHHLNKWWGGRFNKEKRTKRNNKSFPSFHNSEKYQQNNFHLSWRRLLILLLFILLLVASLYVLSPLHHLNKVTVEGNQQVESKDLIATSGVNRKMTKWHLYRNRPDLEQHIVNDMPLIKTATIQRKGFRDAQIVVEEFRTLGYVKNEDFYYPMLENGNVISEETLNVPDNKPLVGEFDEDSLQLLSEQLASLSDDVISKISYIEYQSSPEQHDRVALKMRDGNIVLGLLPTLGQRLAYYDSITDQLKENKGLIDLQVGAFYQPLNPGNNPFATNEEKEKYEKEQKELEDQESKVLDLESDNASSSQNSAGDEESTSPNDITNSSDTQSATNDGQNHTSNSSIVDLTNEEDN